MGRFIACGMLCVLVACADSELVLDAGQTDAAPDAAAIAPGTFAWQQHLFTSFPTVAVAPDDTVIVSASMFAAFDLGGGELTATGSDLLLAHYTGKGSHLASTRHGIAGDEFNIGVALDLTGIARVAGIYRGAGNGGGSDFPTAAGFNAFIGQYGPDGAHVWSKPLIGPGEVFTQSSPSVDGSGVAVFAGYFNTSVTIDASSIATLGDRDAFYLRVNPPNGDVATLVGFGGAGRQEATGAVFDGLGNVILCGLFDTAFMVGATPLTPVGGTDIFVAKLSLTGVPEWAVSFGGAGNDFPVQLTVDRDGNPVLAALAVDSVTFGDGATVPGPGGDDVLVVQLSSGNGDQVWAIALGGTGNDRPRALAIGPTDEIALTGEFSGRASFGGDTFNSGGFIDMFVVELDSRGNHVWSRAFGAGADDRGLGVAIDSRGSVYAAGAFHDTVSFGGPTSLTANVADWNGVVVKFD